MMLGRSAGFDFGTQSLITGRTLGEQSQKRETLKIGAIVAALLLLALVCDYARAMRRETLFKSKMRAQGRTTGS